MENPGYIALSRQMVLRQQMDVVANNLANLGTPAFKSEGTMFVEYLKRTDDGKRLSFVQDLAVIRNLDEGPITKTENPLDLAIRGDGYFVVETPAGERFTRNGSLSMNQDGEIVTLAGDPVLGDTNAPIVVPPGAESITVARDGTVSTEQGPVGRIQIVNFQFQQLLRKTAGGLYDAAGQNAEPTADAEIQQGMIEGANVKGVVEMTRLIETVRSYQAAARMADEEHKRQRQAIENLVSVNS